MSEMTWGILLVGYLFLGGLAGGAFVVGAFADLLKGDDKKYRIFSKSGILVSLFAMIIGLVLLVVDLKRFAVEPLSILNVYARFPGSILTVGTWIVTAFIAVSLVTILISYFNGLRVLRKVVEVLGIVLGVSTAAYTGLLLSFSRGIPFWGSALLPVLFVVSGVLTGLAFTIILIPVVSLVMPRAFGDFKELYDDKASFTDLIEHTEIYAQILTVIEIAILALYILTTPTTGLLLSGSSVSLWFYIYILMGLLMPLGLSVYNSRLVNPGQSYLVLSALLGNFLVLFGGLLLRYVVLIGGQLG